MNWKSGFAATAALAALGAAAANGGVHGYTPKGYVQPKDPALRERLEWFKDQKIALMMHWGLYAQPGIIESWALSDADAKWSRRGIDWTDDPDTFKREYMGLMRSFNPIRFRPDVWADAAARCGFKYLIFTTKHHDGFCMFDSKLTDFKVTSPQCPFSSNPRADVVRSVFDAFRAKGVPVVAYFSKPDWHHPDYWDNCGIGIKTSRMPSYDVKKNPERWKRFREYTRAQIMELVNGYGRMEALWLDGGQVQRRHGLDIGIEEIIAEARKVQPWLISVDRTAGGPCENVITPEQTVPKHPIAVPWESCITIGGMWGYGYDDTCKPLRRLVHLLVDVVAKGGNLALDVGPQPDGRLPREALKRMEELGAWLGKNGEAIYETRPTPPFRKGAWAFTRNRRTGAEYAIRLWQENEARTLTTTIPGVAAAKVVHVGSGLEFACTPDATSRGVKFAGVFKPDECADVFKLVK